ncbi:MAG: (E)-4-hydroxy-3-methylbut-2-enyl-diphosphate synthase [Leptospiraceae bacterium]|nr:(E)-4-hydroxy-3-methylbut-2-enyl-diphosphate synthase [Leptospiraceae bacterium]MCP5513262.1 (E)-4-hydroxy-3-methylbut-2-enyl-diphosphate synthase [Leptospiraceae bacterium]
MNLIYNSSPFEYKRWKTREVSVGDVRLGGNQPIRIQSMVTSDTLDTSTTVQQILDLENAGCEIVRLTVPSMKDAENLPNIRKELKLQKSRIPLVADIHFTPAVAMKVVESVEKIRINPGNFADKKKFKIIEYSDREYRQELERISETFLPLVRRCKELGVSMRIGTNHGSLSDRIMNRYGDTPLGMVESAWEFLEIAESEGYRDIVLSMKASNPLVMVHAYRSLVSKMIEKNRDYPLHLGVTEAGDGNDGRIKSSMGIGSLLEDGLGDTIRVSLTEDAVHEIPVAKRLVEKFNQPKPKPDFGRDTIRLIEFRNPFRYSRFYSEPIQIGSVFLGENHPVRIESFLSTARYFERELREIIDKSLEEEKSQKFEVFHFSPGNHKELKTIFDLKSVYSDKVNFSIDVSRYIDDIFLYPESFLNFQKLSLRLDSILKSKKEMIEFFQKMKEKNSTLEVKTNPDELPLLEELIPILKESGVSTIFSLQVPADHIIYPYRKLALYLGESSFPILLSASFTNMDDALYNASIGFGSLLLDGIGDMIRIISPNEDPVETLNLSYDILQSARLRTTKTEYISCPSCGRTLFDLQDTTARIKSKTSHLKGVKIAIMGCIVNGPGEMADADFGYVGAGPGKVHLYRGKDIVSKSIPSEIADEKLIDLIKESGMWVEN